jgi:pimeloyl-ACP methyl ester carboxylesterase
LQIWGDQDPITSVDDVNLFQSAYGGPVELYVVPGGGHVPYYEPGAGETWSAIFDFLDRVHSAQECGSGAMVAETDQRGGRP